MTPHDLEREFLGPAEGDVAPDALVVRPSLWAILQRLVEVFLALLPLAVSLAVALLAQGGGDLARDGPLLILLLENLQFALVLLVAFAPAVQVAFTRYTFDAEGIRVRTQVLQKSDHRVPWEKVTALRHRRTLLDRLLGLGRLDVIAYGEKGTVLRLVGLRDDGALRDLVARRMRETASVAALVGND